MYFPLNRFAEIDTPFYYYDLDLLRDTLNEINVNTARLPYKVHYAIKANANDRILKVVCEAGLGVDCVSGGELKVAVAAGFTGDKIVFAGVGKTDNEINLGLDNDIACFNVESIPELEEIDRLAAIKGKIANVAIRVNPNIDAHTHKYITTGLNENKFGINLSQLDGVIDCALKLMNVKLVGLHFHIGSQLLDFEPYVMLCQTINNLQESLKVRGVKIKIINVGGGLGVDYESPDENPIPQFKAYFDIFKQNLKLRDDQELHFELGRSVVAQCGSLITRTTYVKEGTVKKFIIVDAGMTDLIRPALYQAHHKIENISSNNTNETDVYDVVGPVCESSDCFGVDENLPITKRGDLIALRSAGAYGQIMASQYNCRNLPKAIYS